MKLLIVDSPNHTKTILRHLPSGWRVAAAVDWYPAEPDPLERATLERLAIQVRQAGPENVYLGTAPNRAGEAFAIRLCQALELNPDYTKRILFPKITASALASAIARPRVLDRAAAGVPAWPNEGRGGLPSAGAAVPSPEPDLPRLVGSWEDQPVTCGLGPHGGWVKYRGAYYDLQDHVDPRTLTLEAALAGITAARVRRRREVGRWEGKPVFAGTGRRGRPFLQWNGQEFALPRRCNPTAMRPEQALVYLLAGLAHKKAPVLKFLDRNWSIRRTPFGGLYLSNGRMSAPMPGVSEFDAERWDWNHARAHLQAFIAKRRAKASAGHLTPKVEH